MARSGVRGDHAQHKRPHAGRRDRIFRIALELPRGFDEDLLMDFLETSVNQSLETLRKWQPTNPLAQIDPETVCVKRHSPRYADIRNGP